MAGNLNLSNNKIINVGAATSDKDALSRVVADGRYLKLSGGRIAENLTVPSIATRSEHNERALNYLNTRLLFVEKRNAYIYIYIYIQLDVHRRSQDSALLAVKERNRPVGELLKS